MPFSAISRALKWLDAAFFFMTALLPTGSHAQQSIQWHPMVYTSVAGDSIPADSARVTVPERHANPNGPKIQLAVIRIRSTAAKPGTPIVYLAGGPGGSGTSGGRGEVFSTIMGLRTLADVILYDQRGTGRTLPSLVVRGTIGASLTDPLMSEAARQGMYTAARTAAADIKSRGIDLSAYNTVENADDLDDLRAALGVDRLVVWGHSYGSHLALAYVKRHNARVERLVVGGINGLDQRRRFPLDGDALLARIDSVVRVQKPGMDFLGMTRRVLDRLAQSPVTVRVDSADVLVGKEDVQMLIALRTGEQDFIQGLPSGIARMDAGDFAPVARMVRDVIRRRPLGTAMTYAMDMSSGVSPARLARIRREEGSALLGRGINYPFDDPAYAEAWGIQSLPDDFRAPVKSNVPAMFFSGTLDGRTSIPDAEDVRRGFPNSGHIIMDGSAHSPYSLSPELRAEIVKFVAGGAPPSKHLSVPVQIR